MYKMTDLSWKLLKLRKTSELTGREAAEKIGISPATLGAYETGNREPTMAKLIKIAKFYGVSIDWLCGMEDVHDA